MSIYDYYVKELLIFVKSLIPIEILLLDRGFYSWGVIKVLQKLKLAILPDYKGFDWVFATNMTRFSDTCAIIRRDGV